VAWPLPAHTQQSRMPVIGALHAASREGTIPLMAAYREGLGSEGYVEGRNVTIEYRWADGVFDRLPAMMADLVRLRPDVITAFGWAAAVAAHAPRVAGTAGTIPIVLSVGGDPVAAGIISSMNRPDNNITGATSLAYDLAAKRVELLHELVRTDSKLAMLANPTVPAETERREVENAARALGWQFQVVHASTAAEFDTAFATLAQERVGALIIATDTFFYSEMRRLASLAAQHALPAIGPLRDFPAAGGLMSYSTSIPNTYRQAGVYTGKVLKGVKPIDLPFFQPTRFELVINLTAAKALGLTVPQTLLVAADELIE
jgi:putative tryptophan/tyrosine transport system substrate-binding protein